MLRGKLRLRVGIGRAVSAISFFNDAKAGSVMSLEALDREFERRRLDQCRLPAIQEQRTLSPEAWRGVLLAFVIMAASIAAIVAGVQLLHSFRF